MNSELDKLQLEIRRLQELFLRTNPLINSIFMLQEKKGKERFQKKELGKEEWLNLEDTINSCYLGFIERLNTYYPNLTDLDIKYCCLLKLHIPTVDIATLMLVKMSTVFMVKYRMYKLKIGVKQNLSFDKFLDEF